MKGIFFKKFIFSLLFFMLYSCGLPVFTYLSPVNISTTNEREFTYSEDTGIFFQGFELYYKIYPEDSALITTDANSIAGTTNLGITRLKNAGFNPLVTEESAEIPLIDSTYRTGVNWNCTLSIDILTGVATVLVNNVGELIVYRNLDTPKSFESSDFDLEEDSDLVHFPDEFESSSNISIVIYVVAFGYDSSISPVYSEPNLLNIFEDYRID